MFFQKKITRLMKETYLQEEAEKIINQFYQGCEEAKQNGKNTYNNVKFVFSQPDSPYRFSMTEVIALERLVNALVDNEKFGHIKTSTEAGDNLKFGLFMYTGW